MKRLLIVDDDPTFRLAIRAAVEGTGSFEIVGEAATGREAIELVSALLPDVVVMDYAMPVMDGGQASHEIYRRWPWIRVVMLTGSVFEHDAEAEIGEHVSMLLTKDMFDPSTLTHALLGS
jgi:CheY-like chemotaxis protein